MLGFDASERTISRWMKRVPRNPQPAQRRRAFFANHREAIAAMDFFTVPTITFGVLYCFFVIRHESTIPHLSSGNCAHDSHGLNTPTPVA